jgi:acyl-CoA thioesterase FadM
VTIFTASKQKEFRVELVVTQGDITPYGSASFINYIRWYGIARDALLQWRNLGLDDSLKNFLEIDVPFCNVQYKRQAMLQDEIVVKVNSANITENSFSLLFILIKKSDALLISLGKQDIRLRDSRTGEVLSLPEKLVNEVLRPINVDESAMVFKF